jgi:methyl-accepting chemotaxis protein
MRLTVSLTWHYSEKRYIMKLSLKVSLIVGGLVFLFMAGLAFVSDTIASGIIEGTAKKSLQSQSNITAALVSEMIHSRLNVLQELANRAQTKTMDFETQKAELIKEIDRVGADDFAIVYPDGKAPHLKGGQSPDLSVRDYVQRGLRGEQSVSDIIVGGAGAVATPYPLINYVVPITANGTVVGGLLARNNATLFSDMVKDIGKRNGSSVYLINGAGVIIAHQDTELVMQSFSAIELAKDDSSLRSMAVFIEGILKGSHEVAEYARAGKSFIGASTKVPDMDWFLIDAVEKDEFFFEIRQMLVKTLTIAGVAAVIAVFIFISVLRFFLIKPILEIESAAQALANMKFNIDIPRDRKDEIGDVQRAFHTIRDELKKTLTDINNEHLGQKNVSGNLHISIRESSDGLGVIAHNMESVQNKTDIQMDSVVQTADSVEGIIKHIHSLESAVDIQADTISRSSRSIEQMVGDIDSVRTVTHQAHETTGNLSKSSEAGRKMLNNLTEELTRIADQSAFLEKANAALVNIAAQTNILAMNAAIEAAHAGEAGRGFAVVAGEVRSLAELSNKESASISAEIKNMRDGIEKMRQVSAGTVDTLGSMFTEVTDMQSSLNSVNAAVEAQASNGSQVLKALTSLRETTDQVRTGSDEIQKESDAIHNVVENLKTISKDVNDSILDVQKASKGIANSLEIAQKIAEGHYLVPPEE